MALMLRVTDGNWRREGHDAGLAVPSSLFLYACMDEQIEGLRNHHQAAPSPLWDPTHPTNAPHHPILSTPTTTNSGPQVVLVSSLAFIGVVVLLHIWAKFTGAGK